MVGLVHNDVVVVVSTTPAERVQIGVERLDRDKEMTQVTKCRWPVIAHPQLTKIVHTQDRAERSN